MVKPRAIQPNRRYQFCSGSDNINKRQLDTPSKQMTGANGTRNGLAAVGFVNRRTRTAPLTTANAKSVPMFVSSNNASSGNSPANPAESIPTSIVLRAGVRKFG